MAYTLKKTDLNCSNVELIDSNQCLLDSLPIINSNISRLQTSVDFILKDVSRLEESNFMTIFYNASAKMVTTMLDIQKINSTYISSHTTVQNLSSQWNYKEFSLYFPDLIDFELFYQNPNSFITLIANWLNYYFAPSTFAEGQVINLFITLTYKDNFNFVFKGNYIESCAPNRNTANTLSCTGCGSDTRSGGCNHDTNGRHWCDNAYKYCTTNKISDNETYSCKGYYGATYDCELNNTTFNPSLLSYTTAQGYLNIDYQWKNLEDVFISRILKFKIQNENQNWVIL